MLMAIKKLSDLKRTITMGKDETDFFTEEIVGILDEVTEGLRKCIIHIQALEEEVSCLSKDVNSLCDDEQEGHPTCDGELLEADERDNNCTNIEIKGDVTITHNFFEGGCLQRAPSCS